MAESDGVRERRPRRLVGQRRWRYGSLLGLTLPMACSNVTLGRELAWLEYLVFLRPQ
jgi:hypothetical protein